MAKIISTVLLSVILGYAICLGVHRHDAGADFRRGEEQGSKELCEVLGGEDDSGMCIIAGVAYSGQPFTLISKPK